VGVSAPRVVLSIDRLVLRGVPAEDRAALVEAFRAELARLVGAPGAAASLGPTRWVAAVRATTGEAPAAGPATGPVALGRASARGLLRSARP
jgi:hypothetical protein